MTISYPLSLPSVKAPDRIMLKVMVQVAMHVNQYTLQQTIAEHQGAMWMADVNLPPMERADAEYWNCFLLSLWGSSGTFLLGDNNGKTPRGSVSGIPVVRGSGQSGKTLNTQGWTPNATGVLLAGDYIQIGSGSTSRLYKVLADVDASAAGWATLDIFPRLRESPADSAPIGTLNCVGLFRLADSEYVISDSGSEHLYNVSFNCIEALETI